MNPASFQIISDEEVQSKISMPVAIDLMASAFAHLSRGDVQVPVRSNLPNASGTGRALFMPVYAPAYGLFGTKMVSVFPGNPGHGLPSIQGKILAMEADHGRPVALLDAMYLTALRTGAATGLATRMLARDDARVLALFGTGHQAPFQVEAVLAVRGIRQIWVKGTSVPKAEAFCSAITDRFGVAARVITKDEQLLEADIICTATTSSLPVFDEAFISPGTHVNGIGSFKPEMQELPPGLMLNALVVVDHRTSALEEAGDLIKPISEGLFDAHHIHAELGELVLKQKADRTDAKVLTVFKSVGNAIQDLALVNYLLQS